MRSVVRWLAVLSMTTFASPSHAEANADLSIPFVKAKLPNGLVVIFSEDHAVPQVAVNISYNVGSRVERPGRTGFAHLFEHLMFMGTQRAPTKAFDAWMEQAGGRNNAWTAEDRTDYFDIAPPTALPLVLWLEADRTRDLGRLIDKEKLDLQRDVVRNERRQSIENRPYGIEELELPKLLWPDGHPYHHPVIGSHEDLEAASVEDVKAFFETWYDPSNASLAIAGDFDSQRTRELVDRWFGALPSRGKPVDPGEPTPGSLLLRQFFDPNISETYGAMIALQKDGAGLLYLAVNFSAGGLITNHIVMDLNAVQRHGNPIADNGGLSDLPFACRFGDKRIRRLEIIK